MEADKANRWLTLGANIGVLVGIILLIVELDQNRDMTRTQVLADQDDTQMEWARLINDNAELWAKGLDGAELNKLETLRFDSLTNAYFSKRSYYYQRTEIRDAFPVSQIAVRDAEIIAGFPGLEAAWAKRWSRFQKRGANPPYDIAVQGYLVEIRQGGRERIDWGSYAIN